MGNFGRDHILDFNMFSSNNYYMGLTVLFICHWCCLSVVVQLSMISGIYIILDITIIYFCTAKSLYTCYRTNNSSLYLVWITWHDSTCKCSCRMDGRGIKQSFPIPGITHWTTVELNSNLHWTNVFLSGQNKYVVYIHQNKAAGHMSN